jgi:hypothetical protein
MLERREKGRYDVILFCEQVANTQYPSAEVISTPKHRKGLFSFLPCRSGVHKEVVENMTGRRWLQVNDKLGTRYGSLFQF